jgi:hypothetical protein
MERMLGRDAYAELCAAREAEVPQTLDVIAAGGSEAVGALHWLWAWMDRNELVGLLRERGLDDALDWLRRFDRESDEIEAQLQHELRHQPPPVAVTTVQARPRARERRSSRSTRRTQRGSHSRLDDDPEPPLAHEGSR